MEKEKPFRSGFISIIGRPNVGKSTLLNAFLGEKLSIVSPKPQTTRNVVRGIKTGEDYQIIFLDTPGMHRAKGMLNEFMVSEALNAIKDTDGVLYMVEAGSPPVADDRFIMGHLKVVNCPVILAINKIDLVKKHELLPLIKEYSELFPFKEIVPVSALTGDGLDELLRVLKGILPEGPMYFPEDLLTDQPERFIVSEVIREKVFLFTREEIPYSVAVHVESFKEDKDRNLVVIGAVITVERPSQKAIIIGKGGSMLKKIGTAAREDIERFLGCRVYLELFVRVEKNWTKNRRLLKEFGYR
ncbi:MAG TPA: GTPase Era [Deltaproteobacteria bacterium]|nr:GTPase Era [Deltaproteobacteria bacterium]